MEQIIINGIPLRDLHESLKRKWLVNEMKNKWQLDEDDIQNDDCDNNSIVCGNADIKFKTMLELCQQLDWQGFKFGDMEIFIDIKISRETPRDFEGNFVKDCHLPNPDEFSICNGIIRIWYD